MPLVKFYENFMILYRVRPMDVISMDQYISRSLIKTTKLWPREHESNLPQILKVN